MFVSQAQHDKVDICHFLLLQSKAVESLKIQIRYFAFARYDKQKRYLSLWEYAIWARTSFVLVATAPAHFAQHNKEENQYNIRRFSPCKNDLQ
ncbi:hypothetical protein CQA66_06990 [Helicobacter aurati]|uniref:Uncharacterized protein n=1 Tax=Helicobacter aurati TaxID=137778 RepID=A0A3D8J1F0_9HELI|nr:hypothetical protein [Helicobacter aurati]RDU71036.1 hypothetical protein CQA66_06990 [Helicobacter aurati]